MKILGIKIHRCKKRNITTGIPTKNIFPKNYWQLGKSNTDILSSITTSFQIYGNLRVVMNILTALSTMKNWEMFWGRFVSLSDRARVPGCADSAKLYDFSKFIVGIIARTNNLNDFRNYRILILLLLSKLTTLLFIEFFINPGAAGCNVFITNQVQLNFSVGTSEWFLLYFCLNS